MELAVDIIIGMMLAATPLLLAATGELVVERAGVLNLGVEGMMVVGAIIAGVTDLNFDLYGYSLIAAYNVSTAVYLVMIRRAKRITSLSQSGMVYVNALMCVPALMFVAAITSVRKSSCRMQPTGPILRPP